MVIFDPIFGKGKKRQEQLRLEEEARQKKHQDNSGVNEFKKKYNGNPQGDTLSNKFIEDNRSHFYELEDIKYRLIGSDLMLAPYDAQFFFNAPDCKILPILANTEKIRRFLPNLRFADEESTKKVLESYLYKTENQLGVTYVIRLKNMPIGMVFVNTPLYNAKSIGKAIWSIDFFIGEPFEHKGIVYTSLVRVLNEMKKNMGAKVVYALVDQDNHDCINLIGKGLFKKVDIEGLVNSQGGQPPFVYFIDIEHTDFISR